MKAAILRTRRGRTGIVLTVVAVAACVLAWRAPDLGVVSRAFREVGWVWVAVAIGMNLVSVSVRAIAWDIALRQALPEGRPAHRHVFSAFCVGLLANAALPGRVGEVARVAVLARHLPQRESTWAAILGSVFAHRLFDVIPTIGLVAYVIASAHIPRWALPGVEIVLSVGGTLLAVGLALAWRQRLRGQRVPQNAGRLRRLLHQSLRGLRVLHSPGPALLAAFFQLLGWTTQVLAVYFAFKAFHIEEPIAAAALVLLVVNIALAFPLWPGSVGLFQAAVALALLPYGIAYQHGFAYGIGLQAIEASVGVALGVLYLAREGLSFAALKQIPRVTEGISDTRELEPDRRQRMRRAPARMPRPRVRARLRLRASEHTG